MEKMWKMTHMRKWWKRYLFVYWFIFCSGPLSTATYQGYWGGRSDPFECFTVNLGSCCLFIINMAENPSASALLSSSLLNWLWMNTAIKTGQRILNNRNTLLPGTLLNKSCSVPRSPGNTPNGKRANHQMWFSGQEEGEFSDGKVSIEEEKFIILDSSSLLLLKSPKLIKITVQVFSLPGLSCKRTSLMRLPAFPYWHY